MRKNRKNKGHASAPVSCKICGSGLKENYYCESCGKTYSQIESEERKKLKEKEKKMTIGDYLKTKNNQ